MILSLNVKKKIHNIENQITKIDGKLENLLELRLENYISKEEFAEKKTRA